MTVASRGGTPTLACPATCRERFCPVGKGMSHAPEDGSTEHTHLRIARLSLCWLRTLLGVRWFREIEPMPLYKGELHVRPACPSRS